MSGSITICRIVTEVNDFKKKKKKKQGTPFPTLLQTLQRLHSESAKESDLGPSQFDFRH